VTSKQHYLIIDLRACFILQNAGNLADAQLSITMLPNERGSLIQAVRLITGQIIDEQLVLEFLYQ